MYSNIYNENLSFFCYMHFFKISLSFSKSENYPLTGEVHAVWYLLYKYMLFNKLNSYLKTVTA